MRFSKIKGRKELEVRILVLAIGMVDEYDEHIIFLTILV